MTPIAGTRLTGLELAGLGTAERQGRRLLAPLVERGLLTGPKDAPLKIAFPLGETERMFPTFGHRPH